MVRIYPALFRSRTPFESCRNRTQESREEACPQCEGRPCARPLQNRNPLQSRTQKAPARKGAGKAANNVGKAKPVKAIAKPVMNARPPQKPKKPVKLTPFLKMQKQRLMALRDTILDSMAGVAKDTLRARPEGSEASAFGMHQADAGSDAYDKDFALSLLSQEQDALYEIEEALKRIDNGTYGTCEMAARPSRTRASRRPVRASWHASRNWKSSGFHSRASLHVALRLTNEREPPKTRGSRERPPNIGE